MSETIVGTLDAVTEKGDWTTFEINVGTQYPIRLSTKMPELIELGRAAKGQEMEWTFNAVEGNVNPKSGKPYINRYFEGVAPVGTNPNGSVATPDTAAPALVKTSNDVMTKDEWARKDRAADLRACIAIAAGALQHTVKSEPTNDDLSEFAQRTLFVARQFHNVVTFERAGEDVPFLSEHDEAIPF